VTRLSILRLISVSWRVLRFALSDRFGRRLLRAGSLTGFARSAGTTFGRNFRRGLLAAFGRNGVFRDSFGPLCRLGSGGLGVGDFAASLGRGRFSAFIEAIHRLIDLVHHLLADAR